MATRRDAREWALQVLFGLDLNPGVAPDQAVETFMADKHCGKGVRAFMADLVAGVQANRRTIDRTIKQHAEHWAIGRMGVVDRNVLRMGVYELIHTPETPPAVVINEAVDIAKYFSSRESGRFVNGILDKIRKENGVSGDGVAPGAPEGAGKGKG